MPTDLLPPVPPVDPDELNGIHINDAPKDDPTRLLVHYDGPVWPIVLIVGFLAGCGGFFVGQQYGTDHYTISTVCETTTP